MPVDEDRGLANRTVRHPTKGGMVEAEVVEIDEISGDKPIIIRLTDGAVLRMRIDIVEAVRFDDAWDAEGNPLYTLRSGNIMTVLEMPAHLKKGAGANGGE